MALLSKKDLKDLIMSRHPTYDAGTWRLHWDAYQGGNAFVHSGNLFKHKKESPDIYDGRIMRAYYYNYVKRLTRLGVDFVFQSGEIGRKGSKDGDLDNVDRKGNDVDSFMSDVALHGITQGVSYVAVDAPKREGEARSRAEEIDSGLGPYWYRINREDMLNWELDEFGMPMWVLMKEAAPPADSIQTSVRRTRNNIHYLMLWTREGWNRIELEVRGSSKVSFHNITVYEEGPNEIGKVTVVPFYGEQVGDWDGNSWNEDITPIARNLLNVCSLRDDYNFQCAFEMYVFPGADEQDLEDIQMGSHEVISTPAETDKLPFSLSHSGGAAEILAKQIGDHVSEMHRLTAQRLLNTSALSDGASGESKKEDFRATNPTLANLADECERVENILHEFSKEYDKSRPEITADYPDDFDTSAVERELDILEQVDALNFPDEVRAYMQEKVVRKLTQPGKDDDRLKDMVDAIEDKFEGGDSENDATPQIPAPIEQVTQTGAVNPGPITQEAGNG